METRASRRVTIVDVARAAGVSKSLVSIALSGAPRIADETRKRILDVAEELGYRRNAIARSLVRGSTGLLGVLVTDLGNPYHADVARYVESAGADAGLTAIILNGRRDAGRLAQMLDVALELQVDGLVVASSWIDPAALARAGREKPIAVIGRVARAVGETRGFDVVHNDDERGAEIVVDHLRSLGHRRIAWLSGSSTPAQAARGAGWRAAMRSAGALGEEFVADGPAAAVEALVARLGATDAPTAVFASNDATAVELLRAAADAGIGVPGRVSVVGYDDTTLAARWRPGLTTMSQPLESMARTAIAAIASRSEGRSDDLHTVAAGELVVRETTAPPRPA